MIKFLQKRRAARKLENSESSVSKPIPPQHSHWSDYLDEPSAEVSKRSHDERAPQRSTVRINKPTIKMPPYEMLFSLDPEKTSSDSVTSRPVSSRKWPELSSSFEFKRTPMEESGSRSVVQEGFEEDDVDGINQAFQAAKETIRNLNMQLQRLQEENKKLRSENKTLPSEVCPGSASAAAHQDSKEKLRQTLALLKDREKELVDSRVAEQKLEKVVNDLRHTSDRNLSLLTSKSVLLQESDERYDSLQKDFTSLSRELNLATDAHHKALNQIRELREPELRGDTPPTSRFGCRPKSCRAPCGKP